MFKGSCRRCEMGIGIDLFFGWENGIGVTRTGLWSLGMGNEILVIVP